MDPLRFHAWARKLARHYADRWGLNTREDLYQVAMLGLLEMWRGKPDACPAYCLKTMERAVQHAVRAARAEKRQAELVPIEDCRKVGEPDMVGERMEAEGEVERIRQLVFELPDGDSQAIQDHLAGAEVSPKRLFTARKKLRQMLDDPKRQGVTYYTTAPQRWNKAPVVHLNPKCPRLKRATVSVRLSRTMAKDRPRCQICCQGRTA